VRSIFFISIGTGVWKDPASAKETVVTAMSSEVGEAANLAKARLSSELKATDARRLAVILGDVTYFRINADFRNITPSVYMSLDTTDIDTIEAVKRRTAEQLRATVAQLAVELQRAVKENAFIVLSYDSGGMRGVVPAVITQMLEAKLKVPLSRIADLIVGTSIGGAGGLAVALSTNLHEGPTKALELLEILRQCFAAGRINKRGRIFQATTSGDYDIIPLVYGVDETPGPLLRSFGLSRGTKLSDLPPQTASAGVPARPRVVLITANQPMERGQEEITGYAPFLLTNFEMPELLEDSGVWCGSSAWPVWQAVQATSAAKTYFPSVTVDGIEYVDGAFAAANNPSELALQLAHVLRTQAS